MGDIVKFEAQIDARLDRMIEICDETGLSLDHVVFYMGRCSQMAFRTFSDNPSTLPRYKKSRVIP